MQVSGDLQENKLSKLLDMQGATDVKHMWRAAVNNIPI